MSMKRPAGIAGAVCACVALAGCAGAPVDDRPVVRIEQAAKPLPAVPLGQFLPTADELSAVLGTGPNGFMGPQVQGGTDMLLRNVGDAEAVPLDCVSTAYRLQKIVYDASPVRSVASGSWTGGGFDGPPVSAYFGVVQMASTGAAQEFFAATADKWRRCNGQTVALQHATPGADEISRISEVTFDERVVSASVLHASAATASPPGMRALGVFGDCIVDVELADPRGVGGAHPAVGVAQLILDKVAAQR